MSASSETLVQQVTVWALPILLALTLREVAHGAAARALGDPTAQKVGRLSLNPLKHVDPIGTVLVPGVLVVMSVLGAWSLPPFGWARPIPIDYRNMKNPRRDLALVAASGPISNFVMAVLWAILLRAAAASGVESGLWYGLAEMARDGIVINLWLTVLNLLPIPPLDGGRVLVGALPRDAALRLARVEPYGMMILLALIATQLIVPIVAVPYGLARAAVTGLVGV